MDAEVKAQEVLWLVTREAEDAAPVVAELAAKGLLGQALPCLEHVTLDWPFAPESGPVLWFITSRHAAQALAEAAKAGAGVKEGDLVAAVAPSTAAALESLGIVVSLRERGGAVALARATEARVRATGLRAVLVRYPTSPAGLEAPEQAKAVELLASVGKVERAAAYAVRAPAGLGPALDALPKDARLGWLLASPSAVDHLFEAGRAAALGPRTRAVVCAGASTLRRYQERRAPPWPDGVLESNDVPLAETLAAVQRSLA